MNVLLVLFVYNQTVTLCIDRAAATLLKHPVALLVGLCVIATNSAAQFSESVYTVNTTSNVKYGEGELSSGPNLDLLLDVYVPAESLNDYRPVVLLVHGGGWISGDKAGGVWPGHANYFGSRGFVVFSTNYRMTGDNPPTAPQFWFDLTIGRVGFSAAQVDASYAAMVDTASAVRFIRANASTYGVNPNRIFGMGGSAGARNVLHTGLDDPSLFLSTLPINSLGESSSLQLVLDFWGAMINPSEIEATDPPVLIVHGTEDAIVPFAEGEQLDAALTSAGVPHDYIPLPGEGHSVWDVIVSGQTLQELSLDFLITNGDIAFDPDNVFVDFGVTSGAGSSVSPFETLSAGTKAANPGATLLLRSGSSPETFTGTAKLDKPMTLTNSTPGAGAVRLGVSGSRSTAFSNKTGFVSRDARN